MIRGYAIQIISLICIILFWLWLLRQLQHKLGGGVFLRCSLYAALSVILIATLARIKSSLNFSIFYSIILSVSLVVTISSILRRGSLFSSIIQGAILFLSHSLIPSFSPSFTNVRSEESLKQGSLQGGGKQNIFSDNTSLFMLACVSAIVFASAENILFFIKAFHESNIGILNYIIQRSLIPLVIHITSLFVTLIIASQLYHYYGSIKKRKTNTQLFFFTSLSLIIASIGGIIFHLCYNLSLDHQIRILVPLLFFIGIGIISYGLFRSDILYIPSQQDSLKATN